MSDALASPNPRAQTGLTRGIRGWLRRLIWRRRARKMKEAEIDALRKRIVILNSQLKQLPDSSRVKKRRLELLQDRERCEFTVATWEQRFDSPGEAS